MALESLAGSVQFDRDPDYRIIVSPSPLPERLAAEAHGCMCAVYGGDFSSNGFGEDQQLRMSTTGAFYALAVHGERVAACAMVAVDGEIGLVGGVCTRVEDQRRGLSRRLVAEVVEEATKANVRWLLLGTGSRTAARIYGSLGFRGLNGSLEGSKGYNPDDEGEWIMLRDAQRTSGGTSAKVEDSSVPPSQRPHPVLENEDFDLKAFFGEPEGMEGTTKIEPLSRLHWGAAVLLLNAAPGRSKMPKFGVEDGLNAELRLAQAFRDGDKLHVAVDTTTRRICGLRYEDSQSDVEIYCLGPQAVHAALANVG